MQQQIHYLRIFLISSSIVSPIFPLLCWISGAWPPRVFVAVGFHVTCIVITIVDIGILVWTTGVTLQLPLTFKDLFTAYRLGLTRKTLIAYQKIALKEEANRGREAEAIALAQERQRQARRKRIVVRLQREVLIADLLSVRPDLPDLLTAANDFEVERWIRELRELQAILEDAANIGDDAIISHIVALFTERRIEEARRVVAEGRRVVRTRREAERSRATEAARIAQGMEDRRAELDRLRTRIHALPAHERPPHLERLHVAEAAIAARDRDWGKAVHPVHRALDK